MGTRSELPSGGPAPSRSGHRPEQTRPASARARRDHRRALFALMAVIVMLIGVGVAEGDDAAYHQQPHPPVPSVDPGPAPAGDHADSVVPSPVTGTGEFLTAVGDGPVHGSEGDVRRYRVAVEEGAGVSAAEFAAEVEAVLGDPRSWIASRSLRMQRVADDRTADFTIYLATPATSERMCATGGLATEGYTSCRVPGQVIINLARWWGAVPGYGAPLTVYRAYVINHEVGHELGVEHEACPGPGRPAPVMQQQTYGLQGCLANAWPYLDGQRYAGVVIP